MEITDLRNQIDTIDSKLIVLLSERARVVSDIGTWKKQHQMESRDEERFKAILADRVNQGETMGISRDIIIKIWHIIHDWALSIEDTSK
ncbi:chorismate mutase [Candidatus Woesebacteria bacterium]|nr:chorismate mutase [Candidatus Woesebacteria bacterium]